MGDIYEWYIDIFFLVNFLMDAAGLMAAGILCSCRIRIGRLLLVCACATACSILLFYALPAYPLYLLAVHTMVDPLMVAFSFRPRSWRDFFRSLSAAYLVFFVAGGVQQSLRIYGLDATGAVLFGGFLAIGMFLVWQIRQKVLRHTCLAELEFAGERLALSAFCDSGNLLRDPETGREVSILLRSALPEGWLVPEAAHTGKSGQKDLRRISYRTVGAEGSEMEIITLDKMKIYRRGRALEVEKPLFGLFDGKLMERPNVELLLNGAYA